MRWLAFASGMLLHCSAWAGGIFNVAPPASPPQPPGARAPAAAHPGAGADGVAAEPRGFPAPTGALIDAKTLKQYEQLPGESTDAYLARLRALAQRSIDDVERASAAHAARMRSLAPKRQ